MPDSTQINTTLPDLNTISSWTASDYALLTADLVSHMTVPQIQLMRHAEWVPANAISGFTAAQIPALAVDFYIITGDWLNQLNEAATKAITPTQMTRLTFYNLVNLNAVHLSQLTAAQVAGINDNYQWYPATWLNSLTSEAFKGIPSNKLNQIKLQDFCLLDAEHIKAISPANLAALNDAHLKALKAEQVAALPDLASLSDAQYGLLNTSRRAMGMSSWTQTDYAQLTSVQISKLTVGDIQTIRHADWLPLVAVSGFTAAQMPFLSDVLSQLTAEQVAEMTHLDALTSEQFGKLNISNLSLSKISGLTKQEYEGLTADQVATLTPEQIHAMRHTSWMPDAAASAFTADQVNAINISMGYFTSGWLNNLSTDAFHALTPAQLGQISAETIAALDNMHLQALTADQISGMTNFGGLSSAQFSLLDISKLPNTVIGWLSRTQYEGLTAQQISTLSSAQLNAMGHAAWMPDAAAAGCTPDQIKNITIAFTWFTAGWLNNLSLEAFEQITPAHLNEIPTAVFSQLDSTLVSALTDTMLQGLDTWHLSAFTADQVSELTHSDALSHEQFGLLNITGLSVPVIENWTETEYSRLAAKQISTLTPEQIQAMQHIEWVPAAAVSGFTEAQMLLLANNLSEFTAEQVASMTILNALSSEQFGKLDISKLSLATFSNLSKTEYEGFTAQQISTLSAEQIHAMWHPSWMPDAAASAFTTDQVRAINISMGYFTAGWLNNLSTDAFQAMTPAQLGQISAETIAALDNMHLQALTDDQISGMTNFGGLSSAQFSLLDISKLPNTVIGWLSRTQYEGLTAQQIATLSAEQIHAMCHTSWMPDAAASAFTADQVRAINISMGYFTVGWLNNLPTEAFQAMTPTQISQISTATLVALDDAHLGALTAEQVSEITQLSALSNEQFGLLNISQLSDSTIHKLSQPQYQSLTATQISTLSADQIQALQHPEWLPVSVVSGFTTAQILTFGALRAKFTAEQIDAMSHLGELSSADFGLLDLTGMSALAIGKWTQTEYAGLTAQQISALSSVQIQALQHPDWIPTSAVAGFTAAQAFSFNNDFSGVSADWLNNLNIDVFKVIPLAVMDEISPVAINGLDDLHQSAHTGKTNYHLLTAQQVSVMTVAQIQAITDVEWIPVTAASGLTAQQISTITASLSGVSAEWLNALTPAAMQALSLTQLGQINLTAMSALDGAHLSLLDNNHLSALTAAQVGAIKDFSGLSSAKFGLLNISGLTLDAIAAWGAVQYSGLTSRQIASLNYEQIHALQSPQLIPPVALSGFKPEQMLAIRTLTNCGAAWVNALSLEALQALSPEQFYNVRRPYIIHVDDEHLKALTAAQVALTNKLDALSSRQFGLLDISAVTVAGIKKWKSDAFAGLTAAQISSLNAEQIAAIPHLEQLSNIAVSGLTESQIPAIQLNFSQFSAEWLNSLSLSAFEVMTSNQANQIDATTVSALDTAHQSALAALQVVQAAANTNVNNSSDTSSLSGVSTTVIGNWSEPDYARLTSEQIATLSTAQIQAMKHPEWIPAAAIAGLTAAQISGINSNFSIFSVAWLNSLSASAIQALSTSHLNQITVSTISALNNSQFAALTATQVASMTNLANLGRTQFGSLHISAMSATTIAAWSQIEYSGLTASQMSTLSLDQIQAIKHPMWLPDAAASGLSAAQTPALINQMHQLSSGFLNNLNISAFKALTDSKISDLAAPAIDGLDANHLAVFSDSLNLLSADELLSVSARLTSQQKNGLSASQQKLLLASGTSGTSLVRKLSDAGLKSIMQAVVSGNESLFSFTGVSTVLKKFAAELNGGLTSSQYSDLTQYVQEIGAVCGLDSPLYSLASGMIEGANGASVNWTESEKDTRIGSLNIGSTATLFNQLISTWFDGTNEPAFSTNVKMNGKPLFANGTPVLNDLVQGVLGDCSLIASLQAIVTSDPDYIKSMIVENPNNTYSVRFFNKGVADWVTVDKTGYTTGTASESSFWGGIVEHAFVNFESTYNQTANVYSSLIGGISRMEHITGDTFTYYGAGTYKESEWNTTVFDSLKTALLAGEPAVISSWKTTNDTHNNKVDFVGGHMMSIIGFDTKTNDFIIANPWGPMYDASFNGTFEASIDEMWEGGVSEVFVVNTSTATGVAGQLVHAMAAINTSPAPASNALHSPTNMNNPQLAASHV